MSTVQFRALIQQAKQLSPEERRQLMRYLAESEVAERGPSGGPEEDVPRPGPLAPGGRLAPHLQQRDPAVLDEAQRAGLGAAVIPRAPLRGHLDQLER